VAAPVKIRWTLLAVAHLESAHDFVAAERPAAAGKMMDRILSAIEALERHPDLGRPGRVSGTRELVITGTPLIVAYRLRRNEIQVLAVLHGARKWPERF
jgi:toxin ParE1/3/4